MKYILILIFLFSNQGFADGNKKRCIKNNGDTITIEHYKLCSDYDAKFDTALQEKAYKQKPKDLTKNKNTIIFGIVIGLIVLAALIFQLNKYSAFNKKNTKRKETLSKNISTEKNKVQNISVNDTKPIKASENVGTINNIYILSVKDFFINYFNFKGRTSRAYYWWTVLLFLGPIYVFIYFIEKSSPNNIGTILLIFLVCLIFFIPELSIRARRLHDINKSGWWQLLVYTGIGALYIIYLHIKKGDEGANRFGNSTEYQTGTKKNKEDFDDEIQKIEKVEKMYKDKLITDEERKKMRSKILGID